MLLNYLSLAILLVGLTLAFYTFIFIHDIPYQIAKKRNHPQTEAIHIACWLSLFTLHAIWPIVFIWAIMKPPQPLTVTLSGADATSQRLLDLERRIQKLEQSKAAKAPGDQPC